MYLFILSLLIGTIYGLGEIRADCTFHSRLQDDFIVFPGRPGASHYHDFFGAKAIDGNATLVEMYNSESSCDPTFDHSAYWMPTLINNDKYITPDRFTVYYHTFDYFDSVETIPQGLKIITLKYKWTCQGGTPKFNQLSHPIPDCGDKKLEVLYNFPECWDGVNLDSDNHRSHMEFSKANKCPESHPHLLPRVQLKVTWPISGEGKTYLSSGSGTTAHADFVMGFDPEAFLLRVNECSRKNKKCPNGLSGDSQVNLIYESNPVPAVYIPVNL